MQRNHRRCQSLLRGAYDKPYDYSVSAGLRAQRGVREHIFSASGMITPIDNRGIGLERKRKREGRSIGGRTPDNAVPPDTHPSSAVCNYPHPGEIIYECEKEREWALYVRARIAPQLQSLIPPVEARRGEGARYDPPYAVGKSHKSRGGSLSPTSISSYYPCHGNTLL